MSVSRYADVGQATWTAPDGRAVAYLRRRLLPAGGGVAIGHVHEVRAGERVDSIAAAELGDAERSWVLADVNLAMRPSELERPGRSVAIPAAGA